MSNTANRLIAKNTILLYFRTLLVMFVSLFTSRVVLKTLGVEDYGVYNAVGGVVSMFAVISGALTNAISRYITYCIGKGDQDDMKIVFSTSVNIQIVIGIIILILCEVFGTWFLNNRMIIPADRLVAANFVLHFSLLTFVINIISVPYNACIIAHEHMNAYAYIGIIDACLKLLVAYLLIISPIDKLITYSILLFVASLLVRILYGLYCKKNFAECIYKFTYDKKLFREMIGFAGWNFFGNATSVLNYQGINILMNIFFGVIVNSARGIAVQVETAVTQLVVTFTTAINPQITKSYAQGDMNRMFYLVCKGAKFSFFLLLLFAVPLIFEADNILRLWLVEVPNDAPLFMRLSLFGIMVTILGNSGYTACIATGNIKKYSIVITLVGSMNFVISWLAYKLGAPAETAYVVYIIVYSITQVVRLLLMKEMLEFPIMMFVKEVLCMIILPFVFSMSLPYILVQYIDSSFSRTVLVCFSSVIWTAVGIVLFGLTKGERNTIIGKIKSLFARHKHVSNI